jgi:osmotically-inducible protein OsmY
LSGFFWHEIGFLVGMKLSLLCIALAVALGACGRNDSNGGPPKAQTRVEESRQAEKAADAGKPLSDASLTQIVRSALESESSLDARKIDIENKNGNIALNGTVDTDEQREKAGRIVGAVGGVRNVVNNLTVDAAASAGATAGAGATILQRKD